MDFLQTIFKDPMTVKQKSKLTVTRFTFIIRWPGPSLKKI